MGAYLLNLIAQVWVGSTHGTYIGVEGLGADYRALCCPNSVLVYECVGDQLIQYGDFSSGPHPIEEAMGYIAHPLSTPVSGAYLGVLSR